MDGATHSDMRNGGTPPTHFSLSSLSNPSWWLQFKWLQPPPRTPNWVIDEYFAYNLHIAISGPLCNDDWLHQAFRKDQLAAGLLPLSGGGTVGLHSS